MQPIGSCRRMWPARDGCRPRRSARASARVSRLRHRSRAPSRATGARSTWLGLSKVCVRWSSIDRLLGVRSASTRRGSTTCAGGGVHTEGAVARIAAVASRVPRTAATQAPTPAASVPCAQPPRSRRICCAAARFRPKAGQVRVASSTAREIDAKAIKWIHAIRHG